MKQGFQWPTADMATPAGDENSSLVVATKQDVAKHLSWSSVVQNKSYFKI